MMSPTKIGLILILAASLVACASVNKDMTPDSAVTKPNNELTAIEVEREDGSTNVKLLGEAKPVYSVYRMSNPQRIIVDLPDCQVGDVPPMSELNDGLIKLITTNQYQENDKPITRVMIVFERETEFTVRETDDSVMLRMRHPNDYAYNGTAPAPEAETPAPVVQPEAVAEPAHAAEPIAAPVRETPACDSSEPIVLTSHKGGSSNTKLSSLTLTTTDSGIKLRARAKGRIENGSIEVLRLCQPERIVIDLYGVKNATGARSIAGDGEYVGNVRLGTHADKLRLVLDMNKPLADLDIDTGNNGMTLALGNTVPAPAPAVVAEAKPEPKPEITQESASEPVEAPTAPIMVSNTKSTITGIDFNHQRSSSQIELSLNGTPNYQLSKSGDDQVVLELPNTELPPRLEQSLDTSEFNSPISLVSSYTADAETQTVKVVVQTRYEAPSRVSIEGGKLVWRFDNPQQNTLAGTNSGRIKVDADGQTIIEYEPTETAGLQGGASAMQAATSAPADDQRISLELKNTDILDVLRLIADVSKLNIIASDDVSGRITVRLLNVPWQQALDIILRSKGLGRERQGNIIRVAPLSQLQLERDVRFAQIKAQRELEPLSVRLIPVSYSDAADLIAKVQDLISERGTVNFDARTNVIIIKDIDEVLAKAEALIAKLDLQTPQVMIEAKIVEANVSNEYGFGIQWGGYYIASEQTGNPTGLNFPSTFGVAGAQDFNSSPGLPNTQQPPNWLVNVPTTGSPTGGIGFTFGSVNNTANLTLRLSALENAGKIKIVSSPRISTMDNKEAEIQQGLQIPIMTVTINGVPTSKMVNALLALKVTPHITADGSIIMKLEIAKQEPDFSQTNALGDPTIIVKRAKTEVLVRTGETTVIGGVYTKRTSMNEASVPLFSKIPILGWLFKNRQVMDNKSELLVFVTPRIINRSQSSLTIE